MIQSRGPVVGREMRMRMSGHAAVALFAALASLPLISCSGGGSLSGPSTLPERATPAAESTTSASAQTAPNAVFRTNPAADERGHVFGRAPLTVHFNLCGSTDAEDDLNWTFDFGDGQTRARFCRAEHTYGEGVYQATVCVKDRRFADQSTICKTYRVESEAAAARKSGVDFFTDFEGIGFAPTPSFSLPGATFSTPAPNVLLYTTVPGGTMTSGGVVASFTPITITFETTRSGATFGWTTTGGTNPVSVQAYRNGSLVYSQSVSGAFGSGGWYEGTATVPVAFDRLVLSSAIFFVIDNLAAPAT
jgi:hypothetical protein